MRLAMRENLGGRARMQPRNIPARVQIHVRLLAASRIASFDFTARPGLTPIYCLARLLPRDVRQSSRPSPDAAPQYACPRPDSRPSVYCVQNSVRLLYCTSVFTSKVTPIYCLAHRLSQCAKILAAFPT
jgi:hypothetical protein